LLQDSLGRILTDMAGYPSGGWDLSEFDTLSSWADALRKLEGSKSLQALIKKLFGLHLRFVDVTTAVEFEDDDDDDFSPSANVPPPVKTDSIHSRPARKGEGSQDLDSYENHPPVRSSFMSCSPVPLLI
jgi:hypothetical protein